MKSPGWIIVAAVAIACVVIMTGLIDDDTPPVRGAAEESPLYASRLSASLDRFKDSSVSVRKTPIPPVAGMSPPSAPLHVHPRPGAAARPPGASTPGSADAAIAQGRAAFARQDWETALILFDQAVASAPTSHLAHSYRGDVLVRLGRYDEAIRSYQRAYELDGTFLFALHGVGSAQYVKGDLEAALQTYRKILGLSPGDVAARSQIATIEGLLAKPPKE